VPIPFNHGNHGGSFGNLEILSGAQKGIGKTERESVAMSEWENFAVLLAAIVALWIWKV
jgi:hypothetical protein